MGGGSTDSTARVRAKTLKKLEVSETSKKTCHAYQNAFVRLLFVSEPGGQGDPGSAAFGSDLAAVVSGFPQATPQGTNDIQRVHSIFIPASYSANNQFFLTGEFRQSRYVAVVYL